MARRREQGRPYLTDVGPERGAMPVAGGYAVVAVFDSTEYPRTSIGIATADGKIEGAKEPLSVLRLNIRRRDVEGRWIIVDRRFVKLGEAAEEL
jgi:hypothetical protein